MKTIFARIAAAVALASAVRLCVNAAPTATTLPPIAGGLHSPTRLATDAAGSLFVAEPGEGRISAFDAFGRRLWTRDGFAAPIALALDAAGNLLVSEEKTGSVSAFDSRWNSLYQLGAGTGEFTRANYLAMDAAAGSNTVFVCDGGADRIKVYRSGQFVTSFGGTGTANGQFNFPAGVFVSAAGEVFVVDQGNDRVQVFNRSGAFLRAFQLGAGGMFGGPSGRAQGITGDAQGRLYVADSFQGIVKVFDAFGTSLGAIGDFGQATGQFRTPADVVFVSLNRLCVASVNNSRVERIGLDGFRHVGVTPASQAVAVGSDVVFSATVGGAGPSTFQWQKGTNNLSDNGTVSGATSLSLILSGATAADSGAYSVAITGPSGTWVSPAAALAVLNPPQLVTGPASQSVYQGAPVFLNVLATGDALTYHWRHNSADITGATTNVLTLASAQLEDAGSYSVIVQNPVGSFTSDPATLSVLRPPSPPYLDAFTQLPGIGFTLSFTAEAGFTYAIEASANLTDWTTLTNLASENGGLEIVLPNEPGQPMRFYRVKWTP